MRSPMPLAWKNLDMKAVAKTMRTPVAAPARTQFLGSAAALDRTIFPEPVELSTAKTSSESLYSIETTPALMSMRRPIGEVGHSMEEANDAMRSMSSSSAGGTLSVSTSIERSFMRKHDSTSPAFVDCVNSTSFSCSGSYAMMIESAMGLTFFATVRRSHPRVESTVMWNCSKSVGAICAFMHAQFVVSIASIVSPCSCVKETLTSCWRGRIERTRAKKHFEGSFTKTA